MACGINWRVGVLYEGLMKLWGIRRHVDLAVDFYKSIKAIPILDGAGFRLDDLGSKILDYTLICIIIN